MSADEIRADLERKVDDLATFHGEDRSTIIDAMRLYLANDAIGWSEAIRAAKGADA